MNDQAFCPQCGSPRLVGTTACATCGRSFEPVAESLEPAHAPASGWTQPTKFGMFIALVVPISYLALALLVKTGIVPSAQMQTLVPLLTATQGPLGLLGPIGIVIAGWSVGIRGVLGWLVTIILTLPALASLWFYSALELSAATGNPF